MTLAALVLAGGATWWWFRNPADRPVTPPLPAEIQDAEVKQAVETARAKVLAAPRSADDWGHYAMVLMVHSFDREADECLAQAGKLNPTDARWPYGRALLALRRGNPDDAPQFYQQVIDIGDREYQSRARLGLAEWQLERGQIESAAELFRQELGPEPGHPRAVLGLSQIAMARGDEATATRLLMSIHRNPYTRKQATSSLAVLAWRRGEEAAARAFEAESKEASVRVWPDPFVTQMLPLNVGVQGREQRIESLERQGRYADAHNEYLRVLALERSPKVLARAATNLARLGEYAPALRLSREAVESDPNDATTQYTLALVLFTRFEKEWSRDPGVAGAKESCREIVTAAKSATELKSNHAQAYLLWGLALSALGEPKAAQEPLRKGLTFRPGDFELLFGLGQALAAVGDKTGAVAAFEEASQVKPNDPRTARELEKLRGK